MKKIIKKIEQFFQEENWKYKCSEIDGGKGKSYEFGVGLGEPVGPVHVWIFVHEKDYVVHTVLKQQAAVERRGAVAEYLLRTNFELKNGNFDMSFDTGSVMYKTYVNFMESEISFDVVKSSILVPLGMIQEYGKKLLQVMSGDESV